MKITEELLQKYARLIVRTGANVQEGQLARICIAVEQYEFARMLAEECYKAGAKKVMIDWDYDEKTRLDMLYASEETLGQVQKWEEEKMKFLADNLPYAYIRILSEDPDALNGVDVMKMAQVMKKRSMVLKPYTNEMYGKYQWVAAGVPCEKWAQKCFPELSGEEAVQKLWDAILATVRMNEDNDPVADWKKHIEFLMEKSAWLNEQKFASLHYESANGTDFTVGLIPDSKWCGAHEINPSNGAEYIPNMPTEEIFNSPMAGKCEGTLVATKPLSYNGQIIDQFSITFKDGKAVSCKAEEGQRALEEMIAMDETACMLGEVALVPKESPINQLNFLFYNTLFDENACCHVALGRGFKSVLPDGENLSVEEAQKRGVNDSLIHVDFMVGSDDLKITGIHADGSTTPVFENGTWA